MLTVALAADTATKGLGARAVGWRRACINGPAFFVTGPSVCPFVKLCCSGMQSSLELGRADTGSVDLGSCFFLQNAEGTHNATTSGVALGTSRRYFPTSRRYFPIVDTTLGACTFPIYAPDRSRSRSYRSHRFRHGMSCRICVGQPQPRKTHATAVDHSNHSALNRQHDS